MKGAVLAPEFTDPEKARAVLEAERWPVAPVCPHCGVIGEAARLRLRADAKTHARPGTYKCRGCREQFSVTIGTIFEASHIPLNKWLLAIHLLCSSKTGMSARELHRILGIGYRAAWFLAHRIRNGTKQEPLLSKLAGAVEVDEDEIGGQMRTGGRRRRMGGGYGNA